MPENRNGGGRNGAGNILPLGEQLVLATWFARQLGFNAPADMLEKTKDGGDTGEHLFLDIGGFGIWQLCLCWCRWCRQNAVLRGKRRLRCL